MAEKIYAFYDEGAKFFGPPIMAANINMIRRTLVELDKSQQKPAFLEYPKEFVVYEIGSYDQETGQISPTTPPERLSVIADLLGAAQDLP